MILNGIASTLDELAAVIEEAPVSVNTQSLRNSVRESLRHYFTQLGEQEPADLYEMVLAEVEQPMLEMVLQYTGQNQSKAAKILGLSRGTLRKKMAQYNLFKNSVQD